MVKFTIYGEIVSAMRPRASFYGGHAHIYQPKENVQYQNLVSMAYKEATDMYYTRDKALNIEIHAYFKYPSAITPLQKEMARNGLYACLKHKDLDNIAKNILDGLNGIAYDDDKQIVDLHITKSYDDQERVEVVIREEESYNNLKLPIQIKKDYIININYDTLEITRPDGTYVFRYNLVEHNYTKYDKTGKEIDRGVLEWER